MPAVYFWHEHVYKNNRKWIFCIFCNFYQGKGFICGVGDRNIIYSASLNFIGKAFAGKLIIVNGDTTKFEQNPEDFAKITDKIDAELFGLFKET